jgi:hypothetical protein
MKKLHLKASAMALAVALASVGLAGCGEKTDIASEKYAGVPTSKSCEEAYRKPANVAICVRQQSQH